jgi:hypothetical protein
MDSGLWPAYCSRAQEKPGTKEGHTPAFTVPSSQDLAEIQAQVCGMTTELWNGGKRSEENYQILK